MVQHGLNAYGLELKKNLQAAQGLDVAHVEMIKHSASPACGTCLGALCTFCSAMFASTSHHPLLYPIDPILYPTEAAASLHPTALLLGAAAVYAVIAASWCCVNPLLVHRPFRKSVRASYGIKESDQSCGNDFVTTFFCTPCHHIQVATQINKVPVPNVRD
jgi:Cys-rich protein (TIGR01571 family)